MYLVFIWMNTAVKVKKQQGLRFIIDHVLFAIVKKFIATFSPWSMLSKMQVLSEYVTTALTL